MNPEGDPSRREGSSAAKPRPLLIVVAGPTASGKSELAVEVALRLGGEVVNCDSMQIYRGLEVGTAKPSREMRGRVPHHLFDIRKPDEVYSAGEYMQDARRVCREITRRGRIPVVTGGTGLYLKALLEGLFDGPGRSPELRRRLDDLALRKGPAYLYRLLSRVDPETAGRLAEADLIRIVRALEVFFLSGRKLSAWLPRRRPLNGFEVLRFALSLPRPILYDRIHRRVRRMFSSGLIEEVRRLLDEGCGPRSKAFEALGYRSALQCLQGRIGLEEAVALTRRDTRRYAKRQMTWFRKETDLHWIPGPGERPEALNALFEILKEKIPRP